MIFHPDPHFEFEIATGVDILIVQYTGPTTAGRLISAEDSTWNSAGISLRNVSTIEVARILLSIILGGGRTNAPPVESKYQLLHGCGPLNNIHRFGAPSLPLQVRGLLSVDSRTRA